jgi:hypothetical protein
MLNSLISQNIPIRIAFIFISFLIWNTLLQLYPFSTLRKSFYSKKENLRLGTFELLLYSICSLGIFAPNEYLESIKRHYYLFFIGTFLLILFSHA